MRTAGSTLLAYGDEELGVRRRNGKVVAENGTAEHGRQRMLLGSRRTFPRAKATPTRSSATVIAAIATSSSSSMIESRLSPSPVGAMRNVVSKAGDSSARVELQEAAHLGEILAQALSP